MDDIDKLTKNSHLSYGGASSLLHTRELAGDVENAESSVIHITEDEVIVESQPQTQSSPPKIPSTIELAIASGQSVKPIRRESKALGDD